jgi:circadian clock protein KaiB
MGPIVASVHGRSDAATLRLRLYVAGVAPNSLRAIANTRSICAGHFADHVLEIIDLMIEPDRALADRVIVTPTLIKVSPPPQIRLIGDLSDADELLTALSGVPA